MDPRPVADVQSSKVRSILEFTSHLQKFLAKSPGQVPQAFPDVVLYLNILPLPQSELSPTDRIELDKEGVALWNQCSRLRKSVEHVRERSNIVRARAFSCLILQSARRIGRKHPVDQLRVFKNFLKAARDCLETNVLDLASQLLQSAATQQQVLKDGDGFRLESDAEAFSQLSSEYLLLRIALGWKNDQMGVAELFYSKIPIPDLLKESENLERLLDLLYEIGSAENDKQHYETATKWLKRAADITEQIRNANLALDIGELEMNILHAYVRVLLALEDPEAGNEAHRALDLLNEHHGNKLAVMLLQLEILSRDTTPNVDAFFSELGAISRSVHLIEANFKLVMHYLHRLRAINELHAWKALKQFITQRLASHDINDSAESAIVTLIWMVTSPLDPSNLPHSEDLKSWLDDVYLAWNHSLTAEATHGALVLVWRQVEAASGAQEHSRTIEWCKIALHKLFEKAGDQNIGKISRKIVSCYLSLGDTQAALETIFSMPAAAQNHRLSRFLSYSVAVRSKDEKLAHQLLSDLTSFPDEGNRLLFACVSETMRNGSKRQGAVLLQRILDKYNYDPPPEVDTCTLLRCTTQLLIAVLEEESKIDEELLARLCATFKAAARYSARCNGEQGHASGKFPYAECEWFSKMGYNTAIGHLKTWPARNVIDFLQYTYEIQYPFCDPGMTDSFPRGRAVHRSSIVFVQAVLYIGEARTSQSDWTTEDIPRTAYDSRNRTSPINPCQTLYQKAFEKCGEFSRITAQWMNDSVDTECAAHFKENQIILLPLAFEAILHLSALEAGAMVDELSLLQTIDQARKMGAPPDTFAAFADMILATPRNVRSGKKGEDGDVNEPNLPISTAVTLLRKLIVAVRGFEGYDVAQASRWIRCVAQLLLEGVDVNASNLKRDGNLKLLEEIIDQAISLATTPGWKRMVGYPADELEWLATRLFNLGIDFYMAGEGDRYSERDGEAKRWASKSLDVAGVLARSEDGDEELVRVLRERMGRFGWL